MNAPVRLVPPPAAATCREVARDCLAVARDQQQAVEMLLARMTRDPALRAEVMAPWETRAAEALVASVQTYKRKTAWARPAGPDARARGPLLKMAASTLLDFPLPGGKRLRAATARDLAAAATFYRGRSVDMGHKARWLEAVRARLGDAATVGAALDDAALRAIQKETERAE